MVKLSSAIDTIVGIVAEETAKLAAHSLSPVVQEPSISSELGVALLKTAELLKNTTDEVSHEDLKHFIESLRHG